MTRRTADQMTDAKAQPIMIDVDGNTRVSALLLIPPRPSACFVFAHGAGAGMAHPFMAAAAAGLAERGIASLRYQFPYMEKGGKRVDPPKFAHAAVRAAVAEALGSRATLKLFADADHSFHVPARLGRKDADVRAQMLDTMAEWIARVLTKER